MSLTLGVDVACKAAHQASLAVDGKLVWSGRKFFSRPADLQALWTALGLTDSNTLTVVLEPTRNAWMVLAAWFRARGAKVVMVPTAQSADLRAYYSKHAKNDRLDSALLARLPLLHPEGLCEIHAAVAENPTVCAPFYWGKRLACVVVALPSAAPDQLRELLTEAWLRKAPTALARAFRDEL